MADNNEGRPDENGTASTLNPNVHTTLPEVAAGSTVVDSTERPGFNFADWVAGKKQNAKRPHSLVQRLTDRGHGDLLGQPANSDSDAAAIVAQWDAWQNGKPRPRQSGIDAWIDGDTAHRRSVTPAPIDTTDRDRAYAAATLDNLAGELAATPEGSRNHTLNANALRSYRVADRAGIDRQIVTDTMTTAGRACGLDDREISATLRSAAAGADQHGPADIPDGDGNNYGDTTFHADPGAAAVGGSGDGFRKLVDDRLAWLRADAEARRQFNDEQRPDITYPPVRNLDTLLAQPMPPTKYRIDQLAPMDARVMVAAQHKAGKSTLTGNVIRSLVDGDPFLGKFAVNTPATRLVLVDDELSERTVQEWLDGQGIRNTAAVVDVVTLRGNVAALDLLDDECRAYWSSRLRDLGCDYLILDCLRPVLDALGLDEHRDAGRFLVNFDAMLTAGGVKDAMLIHHMGHQGERARGDSRLLDWPDVNWRIIREDPDDPDSARYFHANGRDVAVPEGELRINGRHLTYTAGSRGGKAAEDASRDVLDVLAGSDEPLGVNQIDAAVSVRGHVRKAIRSGTKLLIGAGLVVVEPGPKRSKLHSIANPCDRCRLPVASGQAIHESCPDGAEGFALW